MAPTIEGDFRPRRIARIRVGNGCGWWESVVAQGDSGMNPRAERKNLMLAATIEAGAISAPVRIRNLSAGGAMIDGPALPETGSTLILKRLEHSTGATVIWSREGRCGLRLDGTISIDEWVSGVRSAPSGGSLGQLRVDRIQETVRSGAALPPEQERAASADAGPIDDRIVAELLNVKRMLDAVSEELTDDIDVLIRHATAMQNFDIAVAIVEALAQVMDADDREAAAAKVNMHELRERLSGLATLT